ncbi:hypothetical protein [Pseudorhodoplanes sinuspersici]|uniref:Uncharacterized protein n=1 Tax=Pseudorhodoplanes sinuspersici TaxID=1235591 RepID=A0A1W6ZZG7_9HYPH|nr:hypothetical protein [Pseudorhodoplanes sinuspersici]ARQ02668.1 hypothetical protein CAK95_28875 [Pseudorhodoplanes sinuspersici]
MIPENQANRQIRHDVGGHNNTQDTLLAYMDSEVEKATIKRCLDVLGDKLEESHSAELTNRRVVDRQRIIPWRQSVAWLWR